MDIYLYLPRKHLWFHKLITSQLLPHSNRPENTAQASCASDLFLSLYAEHSEED